MESRNVLPGYVKLPRKELIHQKVNLDFNSLIDNDGNGMKLQGFTLRLVAPHNKSPGGYPEMAVDLTPEQWLDLIEAMRAEFERAQSDLKEKPL